MPAIEDVELRGNRDRKWFVISVIFLIAGLALCRFFWVNQIHEGPLIVTPLSRPSLLTMAILFIPAQVMLWSFIYWGVETKPKPDKPPPISRWRLATRLIPLWISIIVLFFAVAWANKAYPDGCAAREFILTDRFLTQRRANEYQYYVRFQTVDAPEAHHLYEVKYDSWLLLPMGTKTDITLHNGAMGFPWTEYSDQQISQRLDFADAGAGPSETPKQSIPVTSIEGQFSPNSKVLQKLQTLGVSIKTLPQESDTTATSPSNR